MRGKRENKEKLERVRVSVRVSPFNSQKNPSSPIESIDVKHGIINVLKEYDKKTFNYVMIIRKNQLKLIFLKKLQKKLLNQS